MAPLSPWLKASEAKWLEVEMGIIGSSSNEILQSALHRAKEESFDGLLIVLDTPGGALESTRTMVKAIMGADLPVVVWVGPSGARAGSAGSFITLAAHVAIMAEGTNIGAAHPVQAGGQDIEGDVRQKIENDTVAFMESIATARKRNAEMAVSFVVNSVSITAREALEHKVIDFVIDDRHSLFAALNGREIILHDGRQISLVTDNVKTVTYEKNFREKFLEIISNPNLFYLLFVAGLIGIGFELTHPGSLFPGVLGGISLILALIATSVLPVNFGAMLLILVSIAFMVGEVFLPSFGILGIGGFIAFITGSILLVDPQNEQGLRIHWSTIVPAALSVGGFGVWVSYLIVRSERSQEKSGSEAMIGQLAQVVQTFQGGTGKVRIGGELWNARQNSGPDLLIGNKAAVIGRNGLELIVEVSNTETLGQK